MEKLNILVGFLNLIVVGVILGMVIYAMAGGV